jgi:hypothetical protein
MTKNGKMTKKELALIINSPFITNLGDKRIGIKLANKYKGIMPFAYFETLQRIVKGIGTFERGKTIRKEEKW